VIRATGADLVVLQEASRPTSVLRIAELAGLRHAASRAGMSVAVISRRPLTYHAWHKPRLSQHAFLEIVPADTTFRLFGIHLSAIHAAWTERRRLFELNALLNAIAAHQHGPHLLIGDFNTLAPGETLNVSLLPQRLRALVWLSGGRVRWRVIRTVLDRGYVDVYRMHHPDAAGLTFPAASPHVRLDYAFVPAGFTGAARSCDVASTPETAAASDHLPLVVDVNIERLEVALGSAAATLPPAVGGSST
jgi:endonuclease/exonuclease/phosphatase family metal-dependent hydrolase